MKVDTNGPQPTIQTSGKLEMFSLKGKMAVVTGGTGTLGGEIARGLASAGAKVVLIGRRLERGERLASEIEAQGGEATAMSVRDVCLS